MHICKVCQNIFINGFKNSGTYEEIVIVLENDKINIKYTSRSATPFLNSPYVLSAAGATSVELSEQQETMAKHTLVEHIIKQMSSDTSTHHEYNKYVHMPRKTTT